MNDEERNIIERYHYQNDEYFTPLSCEVYHGNTDSVEYMLYLSNHLEFIESECEKHIHPTRGNLLEIALGVDHPNEEILEMLLAYPVVKQFDLKISSELFNKIIGIYGKHSEKYNPEIINRLSGCVITREKETLPKQDIDLVNELIQDFFLESMNIFD